MRIQNTIATSLGALVLALAPIGMALPAAAATPGYHAAYFSESSFLTLSPGQTGQFSVGYTNTGDQPWVKGQTGKEASLHTASPLDNPLDFTAGWGVNWAAAQDRYESVLEHVADTEELHNLIMEMIGELNASHTGVTGGAAFLSLSLSAFSGFSGFKFQFFSILSKNLCHFYDFMIHYIGVRKILTCVVSY